MKKKLFGIIEYLIMFVTFLFMCYFVNKTIQIKALYMDDLFNWAWFPGTSLFDFAIKFYETSTRYRPFYDSFQYLIFCIVRHNVLWFKIVNIVLNSLVALFIYHFGKKLCANYLVSFIISSLYIISHFAYYQIGQVIGSMETEALFFAVFILYICFKYIESEKHYKNWLVLMFIMYFVISFTHERYMGLIVVICASFIFRYVRNINKNDLLYDRKKLKAIKSVFLQIFSIFIVLAIIFLIRYLAIGKVVPAGTGGTYVEDTFKFDEAIAYAISQVKYIFGINAGPQYLSGIEWEKCDSFIRKITYFSIALITLIVVSYILIKISDIINKIKEQKKKFAYVINRFYKDILFLLFIAMCIGSSSVTIRVEMRFVYVSFAASLLFLAYMLGEIFEICSEKKNMIAFSYISMFLLFAFFMTRGVTELYYRSYFKNIYFFEDQDRMNSLAEQTVLNYDTEEFFNKKKVFIFYNSYGMTNFYAKWFFTPFNPKFENNPIVFLDGLDDENMPSDYLENDDYIFLVEDYDGGKRGYKVFDIKSYKVIQ